MAGHHALIATTHVSNLLGWFSLGVEECEAVVVVYCFLALSGIFSHEDKIVTKYGKARMSLFAAVQIHATKQFDGAPCLICDRSFGTSKEENVRLRHVYRKEL